jgi:hypothetical protein
VAYLACIGEMAKEIANLSSKSRKETHTGRARRTTQ